MKYLLILGLIILVAFTQILAQTPPVKFGEVSKAELEEGTYPQEKGAEAVVLCEYATARIIYDRAFKVEVYRQVRVKILKPSGLHWANVQIHYTTDDQIQDLKAYTYNLENGRPVRTPLTKKQIRIEKTSPYRNITRIIFPQVRPGSIIEYKYKMSLDQLGGFYPFQFQWSIPARHVEYWASIPDYFIYHVDFHGNGLIQLDRSTSNGYLNSTPVNISIYRWIGDMLPAFQAEPGMPESNYYYAGVDFTLSGVNFPGGTSKSYAFTYPELTEKLLDDGDFNRSLNNTLLFTKTVKNLTTDRDNNLDKMKAIYKFVQQKMVWNGDDDLFPGSLQEVFRDKSGSSADINMLLINMLRTAGIEADPVVLNTRDNGPINTVLAMASNLNYVVCRAEINGKEYLMDATDKYLPLGTLPYECLNQKGWLVKENQSKWIDLLQNERYGTLEYYTLKLTRDGDLCGHAETSLDGYQALAYRKIISTEGLIGFQFHVLRNSDNNLEISNIRVNALDSLDMPLRISFDLVIKNAAQKADSMVYFRPIHDIFGNFGNAWVKNERIYPIDLGCPRLRYLKCTIELSDSLKAEELPGSIRISMPKNESRFNFILTDKGNSLEIDSELRVNKAWYETSEYPVFREFYTRLNEKIREMAVYKVSHPN